MFFNAFSSKLCLNSNTNLTYHNADIGIASVLTTYRTPSPSSTIVLKTLLGKFGVLRGSGRAKEGHPPWHSPWHCPRQSPWHCLWPHPSAPQFSTAVSAARLAGTRAQRSCANISHSSNAWRVRYCNLQENKKTQPFLLLIPSEIPTTSLTLRRSPEMVLLDNTLLNYVNKQTRCPENLTNDWSSPCLSFVSSSRCAGQGLILKNPCVDAGTSLPTLFWIFTAELTFRCTCTCTCAPSSSAQDWNKLYWQICKAIKSVSS